MLIRIAFKMPDAIHYALSDLHPNDIYLMADKLAKWIKYNEQVTLIYDSELDTMSVEKVKG